MALTIGYQPPNQGASAQLLPPCQTFKETGKMACGKFLEYWTAHGGLRQQGYPISNQFAEMSDVDGKVYAVQYFERAEFELHPEKKAPFDVLLTLLGTMRLKEKYPNGPPGSPSDQNPEQGQYFPETKQWVYGEFLDYWKAKGGLMQQGYPISGRFPEKSDLDGKTYTVQYFERAVFEQHTEFAPPNDVLLTQLGAIRFKKKYPGGEPVGTPLAVGHWGGEHIYMDVRTDGAHLEFDCAHASLPVPPTAIAGRMDMVGTYVQEHGGPVYVGEDGARPARFTGTLSADGKSLTLTITYMDDNTVIGTFKLAYGIDGRVFKCM